MNEILCSALDFDSFTFLELLLLIVIIDHHSNRSNVKSLNQNHLQYVWLQLDASVRFMFPVFFFGSFELPHTEVVNYMKITPNRRRICPCN